MAEDLKELSTSAPADAIPKLRGIVFGDGDVGVKEQAIQVLCDAYVKQQNAQGLRELLSELRTFFGAVPKAKTAKIVRSIIDAIAKIPGSTQLQVRRAACMATVAPLTRPGH